MTTLINKKRELLRNWLKQSFFAFVSILILLFFTIIILSCISKETDVDNDDSNQSEISKETGDVYSHLTTDNNVRDIANHPAFKGFGELLLSRDDNSDYYNTLLSNVGSLMPYHGNVNPGDVIAALNHMIDEVSNGNTIFYDFYTDVQKLQDPGKNNTGLFFFRGKPNAPFAIICPGGGFSYVGSLHEGFPLAKQIAESGLNAFVIRYRIGSEQLATEDLAAAISYIVRNAGTLDVSEKDYSVWGGSAGARMAGNIALNGVAAYGGDNLPKPVTAVIAYTGQSTYSADFAPAFITVAANDGIANVNTVETRVENLRNAGVEVEYKRYETAGHGFGLGTGTDAAGWLDLAVDFWERHMESGSIQTTLQKITYFWEDGNVPATTVYTENNFNYFDPPGFRPNMVYFPAKDGVAVKGAVLVCAGGAFQFRSNNEGKPVAEHLSELGYHSFVVNYRLRPYTMQEGALDLARAIRIVRSHAKELNINEKDIAIVGFSAGGILCGEVLLNFDGTVNGSVLDSDYMPDQLDKIPADACAVGMIYSFYGRLSVASTDVEKFKSSDLPPTYFLYGTLDPFVHQFELCIAALQKADVLVESRVLKDWPHGFGAADGQWIIEFDKWLTGILNNN